MRTLMLCLLVPAAVAQAQDNPVSGFNRLAFAQMKTWILQSAAKMPEENYGFKPVPEVRSFGQILGHIADAQYLFCSVALGESAPSPKVEQTQTAKADLMAALKEAFAYCDKTYNAATDAAMVQTVKLMGREVPKAGALEANLMHTFEHYGNLVTYMRLQHIVPPSTEAPPKK